MTQPSSTPHPSALPQAIPVLSYEPQRGDQNIVWVVRFFGLWTICTAATSLLRYILMAAIGTRGVLYILNDPIQFLADLTSIVFGIAILKQRCYGFYGRMITVAALLLIRPAANFLTQPGALALASILSIVVGSGITFAVLLSIFRHADAWGALYPPRGGRLAAAPQGSSIQFLVSRIGWLYMAQCGAVLASLATRPLIARAGINLSPFSGPVIVHTGTYLAVGVCGLLLCCRMTWAIWVLAAILPMQVASRYLVVSQYFRNGVPFSSYAGELISLSAGAVATVWLLCLLAAKAAREPAYQPT